jgi:predicted AlkP superfamily pyrophosphatase or phosphodiesterase
MLVLLALLLTWAALPVDAAEDTVRLNAPQQQDKPYLVLVSIDGFRWDYPELADTPALDRIATLGLKAEALQPVFPTLTFPNHFSIATGQLPAQHGLVANEFPHEDRQHWYRYKDRTAVQDGGWYLAEPIWVTAERAGMLTAAYYFVGTEADVGGIRPTHWYPFDGETSGDDRVRQVLEWLAEPPESRPHFITLYFEDVDETSHAYGPGSPESLEAIRTVDRQIGRLLDGIAALPHGKEIFLMVLSDHGAAGYHGEREPLVLDHLVDLTGTEAVDGGPFVYLYFDAGAASRIDSVRDTINAHWNCGRAMRPADAPAAWQLSDSPRFADLIVQADLGCAVISSDSKRGKITRGDHGWAPEAPQMRGIFYALGPTIARGSRTGVIGVTELHPLMLSILGLAAREDAGKLPAALSAVLGNSPDSTH